MTILNQHTVHELDDLVKALSYQVAQVTSAYQQCASWKVRDPQGYAAWASDLSKATATWARVSHAAMKVIGLTPHLGWDVVPAEGDYQAVAKAFEPFEDLIRTFIRESQCTLSMPSVPQPTAPDADLVAFKATDSATRWIDKEAKAVAAGSKSIAPYVFGGLGLALATALMVRRAAGRVVSRVIDPERT